jgi:hypothetical protein
MLYIIHLHGHPLLGHTQPQILIQRPPSDPLNLHLDRPLFHLNILLSTSLHHNLSNIHITSLDLNRVCRRQLRVAAVAVVCFHLSGVEQGIF